jgi:RNA polymerase sigma-70 factor (ECF subfamily)
MRWKLRSIRLVIRFLPGGRAAACAARGLDGPKFASPGLMAGLGWIPGLGLVRNFASILEFRSVLNPGFVLHSGSALNPGLAAGFGLVLEPGFASLGFAGLGLGSSGLSGAEFIALAARADEGRSSGRPNGPADGDSSPEAPSSAQPSGPDGVTDDMATLVLDNTAMGAGRARRPVAESGRDPSSDASIMLRVAAGDDAGFTYLAEKFHRPMINFLYRMVRNQAIAEELAQEVFLRVYRSRQSYRAEAKFTTWLYRIATNLAVNYARDNRHERAAQSVCLDEPNVESGTTPDVADGEPSVEQKLLRRERMKAIQAHVMALPERQRMAVVMHKYQELDYREIGEVLKLSESATKSLLFRAYQTLRDKLKDFV